jgi:hypothetical protein
MLLRSYLENKFKLVQDVSDKMNDALIPAMLGMGSLFYVDATNGSDTYDGKSWKTAKATLDAAIGLCTADSGDRILIAPWHAESLAAATSCVFDVAGVTAIGLVQGNQRPTFTLGTAAAATISVTAANCRISGFKIISDLADVAAGITVAATGDGLEVDHCILTDGAAAKELVIGISLAAAADGCKIHDNEFYTVDAGGCASAIKCVGESARTVITRNIIWGEYSVACIDCSTAAQTIITVTYNDMQNTAAAAGFTAHANSTGIYCHNTLTTGESIANSYVGAKFSVADNYTSGAVGASGILGEPAHDAD